MPRFAYHRGVVEIDPGCHAYLQPDGGWGWSNAGLIRDAQSALLVDTLFDERITADMLAAFAAATGCKAESIGSLVNTHANGDHCNGNALLPRAEIYASEASARELSEIGPELLATFKEHGKTGALGEGGAFFAEIFAAFDFAGSRGRLPTRTFSGRFDLQLGDKPIELIEVGPAHTGGDVLVYSPRDRTIFTGDILFIDCTPIMWAGPVANWLRACDLIIDLDVDVIVPGHGPITDKGGVRKVQDYLRFVDREARKRFDAGLSAEDAALDIALGDYDSWGDAERITIAWAAHVTPDCYPAYSFSKRALQAATMAAIDAAARLDLDWLSRGMSDPKSLRANARRYRELKGKEITWPLPAQ